MKGRDAVQQVMWLWAAALAHEEIALDACSRQRRQQRERRPIRACCLSSRVRRRPSDTSGVGAVPRREIGPQVHKHKANHSYHSRGGLLWQDTYGAHSFPRRLVLGCVRPPHALSLFPCGAHALLTKPLCVKVHCGARSSTQSTPRSNETHETRHSHTFYTTKHASALDGN